MQRFARLIGVVSAASLVLVAAPLSAARSADGTASPRARQPRLAQSFTDLGVVPDASTGVRGINDEGDALIYDAAATYPADHVGRWHDGVLTAPQPVVTDCGETTYLSQGLTPDGSVVGSIGYGNTEGSCANQVPYGTGTLWSQGASSPVPWPLQPRPNCGHLTQTPYVVDATGRVGGLGEFNPRDPVGPDPGAQCDNLWDDQGFVTPDDGSDLTSVPALSSLVGLNGTWAVGTPSHTSDQTGSSTYELDNTTSGAVTPLQLQPAAILVPGADDVSNDGTVIGSLVSPDGSRSQAAYQTPTGPATPLPLPPDAHPNSSSSAQVENAAGEIIGDYEGDSGSLLYWPSATSQPVVLDTSVALPVGWQLEDVTAISPDGLLGGDALDADGNYHDIEFRAGRTHDLSATITTADPNGKPLTGTSTQKGKQFVATVTLSADGTAPAPITGVSPSPLLSADPGGKVQQVAASSVPSGGFTLRPGQSTSYSVTYTITGTGMATLAVTASGQENDGDGQVDTETATAQQQVELGQPLDVEFTFKQNGVDLATSKLGADTIRLADDDNGEIAQDVTVVVTVTNISGVTQTDVTAQDPDLLVVDPSTAHDPFPAAIALAPGSSQTIGAMAAGASADVTYTMHVTGNQDFDVRQLVLSSDPAYGDTEKSLGDGVVHALPTALLLVDLDSQQGNGFKTGGLASFEGTVRNLSNTHALDLDPVLTRVDGNGGGQTVADKATPTADGFLAPVTGKVAAGDKEPYHVELQTIVDGGTRATLTTEASGKVVNPDGSESALSAGQVRLTARTSPAVLHLDDSSAAPTSHDDDTNGAFVFTVGALEGLRDWCANGFDAVRGLADIGKIGDGVVAAGGIAVDNLKADYELVSVIKAELALHVFWGVLTPAQKSAFEEQVALDTDAVSDSFKQFHDSIAHGVQAYFQDFQNAWQRGDVRTAYADLGHGFGGGVPEALSLLAPEVVLNKVARGLGWGVQAAGAVTESAVARSISLAGKLKEARVVIGTAKALDGVLAGDNLLANGAKVLKNSFGLAQRDIDVFRNLAKRRNLLVAVRQRNPISTAWLKTREFLVKPELLKIKNVDEMDVKFLGYRGKGGALGVGDYGTVVFKEPDPIGDVYARLRAAGASPEVRKAALKRYYQREEEWVKYRTLYEGYDEKGIVDLGFDKAAQGAGKKGTDLRKFHLQDISTASGRKYYRVQISDRRGLLKYVTGDIDIVAILNADGTLPSAAVRAQLYDDLMKVVSMQHGETFSWITELFGELGKTTDYFTSTKAKLLADHLPGNEQLAVFGPDGGCQAAYFDPRLTVFNTRAHTAYATFVGAYTTPLQKVHRYTSIALGGIK